MVRFGSALLAGALMVGSLGLVPSDASAATCTHNNSRIEFSPTTANVSCGGSTSGIYTSSGSGVVQHDFFGSTYTLSYKSDEAKGDGAVQVLDGLLNGDTSDTTWKLGNFASFGSVLFGIKQASGYAIFELAADEGNWGIFNGRGDRENEYSHWSVWYNGSTPPSAVPVPPSLLMLLAGIGGLGVAARRMKRG